MADESFETVDSLELRINASAKDAADKIESLSTSVANFGAKVSSYIKDVSAFADAIGRISTALGNMSGFKNLRSVIGSAASAAGKMKDKTFQKQFTPAIPPVRAADSITGRTRVVNWQGQGTRRFSQTSDDIAREMNRELGGTGLNNKELSARISAVRELIIKNDESAVTEVKKLADELAGGAGGKNVSSLVQALNDTIGSATIGVKDADIKGFGENLGNVNALLKDSGAKFRFGKWVPRTSQKHAAMVAADDLEGMGISSAEDLYEMIRTNYYNFNKHNEELGKHDVRSDEQLSGKVFNELMDRLYAAEELKTPSVDKIKNEAATAAVATGRLDMLREEVLPEKTETQERIEALTGLDRVASSARESAEAFKQLQQEEDAAWKAFESWNREQDKYYKEDYGGKSKKDQMNLDWKEYEFEQSGGGQYNPDNTETEIAAWKALEDEIDAATEKKQEFYKGSMSAEEELKANAKLRASGREMYEELRERVRVMREAKAADEDRYNLERALSDNTPEMIASKRRRAETMKNYEAYQDLFLNGIPAMADKGVEAGIISRETADAMKEAAGFAREAGENTGAIGEKAQITAQQFVETTSQVDLLRMKLEGVGHALEEAVNSDQQDPEKIARLADQYQKLSDKIRDVGEAAKEAKAGGITLRGVLDAVGKTLEKSVLGQLARVARMRALRAVVKGVASAFKEGIGNMYQWSKGIGGHFASAMDTLASKTMLAKNSVAAAFAPAIEAIIPLVSTVVSWINTASNAIAQFFALLNGQTTWTKATESVEEWGAATKKSAGGAGKAMKDLLADWDELNIIQSETGGGGGGGSGKKAPDYKSMFEEMDVFDEWTEHFEAIKEIVIAIGAGIAAWFAVDTVQDFLAKLGIAGGKVDSIFSKIKKGIVGAVLLTIGFALSKDAGKSYANNGFTWGAFVENVLGAVASAIGGGLLASTFGINPVIGVAIGLGLSVVGTIIGYHMERTENARDYIRNELESQVYGFDVHAQAEDIDVKIQNAKAARDAVAAQMRNVLTDIDAIKVGVDKKTSFDNLYKDVMGEDGLLSRIKTNLNENNSVITLYYQLSEKVGTGLGEKDEEGKYKNLEAFKIDVGAQGEIEKLYTNLGKKFAECFKEGEIAEIKEGKEELALALAQQMAEAERAAEEARGEAQAEIERREKLKGTDPQTVLRNFGNVLKEEEKTIAENRKKVDEGYFVAESGNYAMLNKLNPNSKYLPGVQKNLSEVRGRLERDEYLDNVHGEYAERSRQVILDFINEFRDSFEAPTFESANRFSTAQEWLNSLFGLDKNDTLFKDYGIGVEDLIDKDFLKGMLKNYLEAGFEKDDVLNIFRDGLGLKEETIGELFKDVSQVNVTAQDVDLSGGYVDEDTEDWSLADMESSGGGVGGTAPWFSGPSEESFEMDASGSGLATDERVGEVGTAVGAGFGQLESLMNTASTILRSIETYSRITANKDFTVNVNASTGLGRVAARSAMKLAGVTGEP